MDKINHCINHNRFIPIDVEELTALELIGKTVEKTNEVVEKTNEIENIANDNKKNKVSHVQLKEMYKLDENANFTGSWFGLKKPTLSNEGLMAQVDKNTEDIVINDNEIEKNKKSNQDILPNRGFNPKITSHRETKKLRFFIDETSNFQSIEYLNGFYFCGFDMGNGKGKIVKYDDSGKKISETALLSVQHCASISFNKFNNKFYVANGGNEVAFVREVDFDSSTVERELNFASLGSSCLCVMDNEENNLIVHTSTGDRGIHKFYFCKVDEPYIKLKSFEIPNEGTPQGLAFYNSCIYLYTNNKITVIDKNGEIQKIIIVSSHNESQGICVINDYSSSQIAIGYNSPNRIYTLDTPSNLSYRTLNAGHCMNRRDSSNISLLPIFNTINVRKNGVNFEVVKWTNGIANDNLVESITCSTNEVRVKLKTVLHAVGYVSVTGDLNSMLQNTFPYVNLESDGQTYTLSFYKEGVKQDLSFLNDYSTYKILSIGSIKTDN